MPKNDNPEFEEEQRPLRFDFPEIGEVEGVLIITKDGKTLLRTPDELEKPKKK